MAKYFSKTKGFLDDSIHEDLPSDVVSLTDKEYEDLIEGQTKGKMIQVPDSGKPKIVDRPGPTNEQIFAGYIGSARKLMDDTAKEWNFASMVDAASFAVSSNDFYKAKAQALMEWRDAVWASIETQKAKKLPDSEEIFFSALPPTPVQPKA